jgi:hypothetical protein
MSKFIFLLLFSTLVIFTSSLRTKKTRCMAEGDNCDLTAYCCAGLKCKDYRCAVDGTKENQEEWAPYGKKCDWFHHCQKHYTCQSHRCQVNRKHIINSIAKKIKKSKVSKVNV